MIRRITEKIGGQWLFLIVVCLLYAVLAIVNLEAARTALQGFLNLLRTVLPALGIVFVLLFLSSLLLDSKAVIRYLGKSAGVKAWVIAITAGIVSTGPIYLWYPASQRSQRERHETGAYCHVPL